MASNQIKLSRSSLDNQKSQCIKILYKQQKSNRVKIQIGRIPSHMWSTRALFVYQNDELYDSLPQFAQCTCANNHPTPSTLSYVPIIFDRYTKSHSRLEHVLSFYFPNSYLGNYRFDVYTKSHSRLEPEV